MGCGLWTPGLNRPSPTLLNVCNPNGPITMSAGCGGTCLLSLPLDGKCEFGVTLGYIVRSCMQSPKEHPKQKRFRLPNYLEESGLESRVLAFLRMRPSWWVAVPASYEKQAPP